MSSDILIVLALPLGISLVSVVVWIGHTRQTLFVVSALSIMSLESTRDFSLTGQESTNFIRASGTLFTAASFQIHVVDVFIFVFSICAIAGIGHWSARQLPTAAFMLLAMLVLTGLCAWVLGSGMQEGVNEWRGWLIAISAFAYTSTRPRLWQAKDLRTFGWVGLLAVGLLVLEVSKYGLNAGAGEAIQVGAVEINGRTIGPSAAFIMLAGGWFLALIPSQGTKGGFQRAASALCFLGVVIAQQRTMWIAMIASVAVWVILQVVDSSSQTKLLLILRSLPELLLAGLAAGAAYSTTPALQNSATSGANLQWRENRWDLSLSTPRSTNEWLTGISLGPNKSYATIQQLGINSAHSFYISTLETVGLLGLAAALCIVVASLLIPLSSPYAHLSITLLAATLGSGYSYDLQWLAFLYVGALGAMNAAQLSPRRTSASPLRMTT